MGLSIRQRVMKVVYPLIMWGGKKAKGQTVFTGEGPATLDFYSLSATLNNGKELPFETLRGKPVLLVNTASDCGFTPQYAQLQQLYEQQGGRLVIIGFPANDFKEQEKGSDAEIAQFCFVNFGVTFPLTKKAVVVKGDGQHAVYRWLTTKQLNGWNDKAPSWNFSKYLINAQGILTHYFEPSVSPLGDEVAAAVGPGGQAAFRGQTTG